MKKILGICLLLLFGAADVFAWGQNGHRVVGEVAQQHLKRKAEKQLMDILDCNSLAEVSVWMDDIRSDSLYDYTHDWHWVTIPEGLTYAESQKNPKGDILMQIEALVAALKKGGLDRKTEQEYIKYLVHLVGDLHQPLHVSQKNDRGGNDVKVQWFGKNSNLHRVWDSEMIDSKDLSFTELARFLGKPAKSKVNAWQSTPVEAWAMESQALLPQVYDIPENNKLGYQYMYKNYHIVEHRLLQAGVRLAGLLNEIYG